MYCFLYSQIFGGEVFCEIIIFICIPKALKAAGAWIV